MGDSLTNGRDSRVDNAIVREVFGIGGSSYDSRRLAQGGVNYQQQRDRIGARFDAAKEGYASTGERRYLEIQRDMRDIAGSHLDADLRQFRMSRR
jgi:hypothetical protein